MKLYGPTDDEHVIASVSRYDCAIYNGLMADGGQAGCQSFAGYNRFSVSKKIWFEVPQNFAELTQDYNDNFRQRKYGIWKVLDVRVLNEDEYPDTNSFEWRLENYIWGSRLPDNRIKWLMIKDMEKDHIQAILNTQKNLDKSIRDVLEFFSK